MMHVPPIDDFARSSGLLPVTADCPGLGTTLLFNSARRACALLEVPLQDEPDWSAWTREVTRAGHLLASDLLVPEAQLACELLQRDMAAPEWQLRQAYRRAYWAEMARNQGKYFAFFDQWDVPEWVLQSLRASCAQEQLLQQFEQVLMQITSPSGPQSEPIEK